MTVKTDVIVIGAGMSGIMATRTLHEAGVNVICLEGRARIGGRTNTDRSLGVSADLGAAWIHGPIGNPLTPIAQELGIAYGTTDFINRSGTAVQAYGPGGEALDMAEYTAGHYAAEAAFTLQAGSLLQDRPSHTPESFAEGIKSLPRPEGMSPTRQFGFDFWSDLHLTYLCAADRETISWPLLGEGGRLPGDDYFIHGGGFKAIIDHQATGLDIRTSVQVSKITHSDAGITVDSSAGQFTADQIIVTAPLGVLKANNITFDPPLPAEKQAVIGRIGFGHYEKVVMRFDNFYWPRDKQRFISFHEAEAGEPQLFPLWFNIGYYTDEPVLLAYHAGHRARLVNSWDDEYLVSRATAALRRMMQDESIPNPTAHVRTTWQADPFSQGSYSYNAVGQQAGDRNRLREPIGNHLFIAGEATHPYFYGTVHGAYETGVWAAQQVQKARQVR